MKIFNRHKYYLWFVIALVFVGVPTTLNAQYKLLAPIPGIEEDGNFSLYFNSLFDIAVLVGSILAVLAIAIGGVQYMTTDAISQKKDAKIRIQMALMGLLMLLATFLFFNQIGGDSILELNIDLKKSSVQEGEATPSAPGQNNIFSDPNL